MQSAISVVDLKRPAVFLAVLFLSILSAAQTPPVNVSIDASKTGAPISKYVYGQFLEHGGLSRRCQRRFDRRSQVPATVLVDKKPEVQVEDQTLGPLPDTIQLRPFSVNIYSYSVQ